MAAARNSDPPLCVRGSIACQLSTNRNLISHNARAHSSFHCAVKLSVGKNLIFTNSTIAHIYCTLDQVENQIYLILEIILKVLNRCEFTNIKFAISTRPESSMGSDIAWQQATDSLKNALSRLHINYTIKEGEGAFYGPKIEIVMQDSMKREWQCGTIQVDFFQAENFDLSYVTSKGS